MSGPVGYIVHEMSSKLIHPRSGKRESRNDDPLIIWGGGDDEERLQVRFLPQEGLGRYGYIEHVSSGKIVHPRHGRKNPGNKTDLVYHSNRYAVCLFAFDEENHAIRHIDGKYWHSKSGRTYPSNGVHVVLFDGLNEGSRFYFVDKDKKKVSPYPSPTPVQELSPGPTGYIVHKLSSKLIHPGSGKRESRNDDPLIIWGGGDDEERLQVRFLPVEGHGRYGYIEHVSSGKIVHPRNGRKKPGNKTRLIYHSDRHSGCLFAFDEGNHAIRHIDGKFWHSKSGRTYPSNGVHVVLFDGLHEGARFDFVDKSKNQVSPYPLSGGDQPLHSVSDPCEGAACAAYVHQEPSTSCANQELESFCTPSTCCEVRTTSQTLSTHSPDVTEEIELGHDVTTEPGESVGSPHLATQQDTSLDLYTTPIFDPPPAYTQDCSSVQNKAVDECNYSDQELARSPSQLYATPTKRQ